MTLTEKSDHLNYLNNASTRLHTKPNLTPADCLCLAMTYILQESKHKKLKFHFVWIFNYFMTFRSEIHLNNLYMQDAQIPGARSPRRLNFVRRRLTFSRPLYRTCFYPPLVLRMLVTHTCLEYCAHSVLSTQYTHRFSIIKTNWLLMFHRNKTFLLPYSYTLWSKRYILSLN